MDQNIKDEILSAIIEGRIEKKDTGNYQSAHSVPYFYKTSDGENWCLLRARKDGSDATQERIVEGYERYKTLFPFLQKQNLGAHTPRELEILSHDGEIYGVMERFFGHGHSPDRFAKATEEQQQKFVKQMANFFYRLHSISLDTLPKDRDYKPYFKYDKNADYNKCGDVFLHGDVNYSNFLIDDDYNLHAVFDWEPACIGPRLADFCTFVYCKDLPMLPLVLDEYNKLAGTSITPKQVVQHEIAREDIYANRDEVVAAAQEWIRE